MTATPTDALCLVPDDQVRELAMQLARSIAGLGYPVGLGVAPPEHVCMKAAQGIFDLYLSAPASPLPEGGGQCSGISGQLKSPDLDALEKLADEATPGEWTVYGERIDSNRMLAAEEALAQVNLTEQVSSHFWMLNADGKCPALTGCGPTSEANAAFIAAANPATIKAMIAELKEARGLVEQSIDLMTDEYEDTRAHQEQARAFLARNGKGEG